MASISQLESLLARVRRRAAEPRPGRPASRVALRSYAEIEEEEIEDDDLEDDEVEEYDDEIVEIVDEPAAPAAAARAPVAPPPALNGSPPPAPVSRRSASPAPLSPVPVPVRQSSTPAGPVTQRSEPPPPPLPLPSVPPPPVPPPPPSWNSVAARARRSIRPASLPPPSGVPTAVSAVQALPEPSSIAAAAESVVLRSPLPTAPVAESRGQRPQGSVDGFDELLKQSLGLGRQ